MTITDIAVYLTCYIIWTGNLSNSVIELVDSRCFMQQYITQQHCQSHNVSYQQVIQPETIINTTILSPVHESMPIKRHFIQELLKIGTNCNSYNWIQQFTIIFITTNELYRYIHCLILLGCWSPPGLISVYCLPSIDYDYDDDYNYAMLIGRPQIWLHTAQC